MSPAIPEKKKQRRAKTERVDKGVGFELFGISVNPLNAVL
jgi:hypothetical protein